MEAEVWSPKWAMIELDGVLLTATNQRLRVKLPGIINMNGSGQSMDRPVESLNLAVSQPRDLWENCMGDRA